MSYSKEQTQTIALVVLIGLVIAVGSYMGMIKPNLGRAGKHEASFQKLSADLAQQRRLLKSTLDDVQHAKAIEARTAELEASLRHGLFAGRLTSCFEELRRAHGFDFRFTNDLERIEPVSGGRYYELANSFEILSCQFFNLVRFLQVLETTHPSVRISSIEVWPHDTAAADGRIVARIELRVFGLKDGQDAPWESASVEASKLEGRNPFAPPGVIELDVHRGLRAQLALIQFQGTIDGNAWLRPAPGTSATVVKQDQRFRLGAGDGEIVRLVRFSRNTLVVYHEASSQYFKLTLFTAGDRAGQVESVEEITPE
ncbi:MAG: hypothetical protein JW889_15535 [Verrucomicrobia bacterium]|nr:hypothetical protein [Verrucomicrobiota bacterium]